jgi:hypothetical protein
MTDKDINYEPVLGVTVDLLTLVTWMADNDHPVDEIVRAIEKPWKYKAEAVAAYLDIDAADFFGLVYTEDNYPNDTDEVIKRLREFAANRDA